jgi:ATP-dependent DNA helicase HFM1/MER3
VAPIKALCNERYDDWVEKFGPLGLKCQELTGDSDMDDYFELQDVNIILTTPEKWDSMTRRWRDNTALVQLVRLFLIDEVHLLNDDSRGATLEAVVSRMKTAHACLRAALPRGRNSSDGMRFLAMSATCPNVSDIASWLDNGGEEAVSCRQYVRLCIVLLDS